MKRILFSLIFTFIFLPAISQKLRSEFEIFKAVFNTEKTNYIAQQMSLNENEEKLFWPIYEDYEIDRAKFSGKRWDTLQKYALAYTSISRSDAVSYTNDLLNYQKKELRLKKKYFNMISSKLSASTAARFIQLEEYINYRVKYAILGDLSFVQQ